MTDKRIIYTEEMVGAGHPGKSDTLNRLSLVEHNVDGTHYKMTNVTDPWIDVRAHGAAGDGVTNDATAIQNALNALGAAGGKVRLSRTGRYYVASSITIPEGCTLEGWHDFTDAPTSYTTIGSIILLNASATI